ncbi:MAG: hypothetical protein OEL19_00945 [Sulfurimonas sp.]|nr:hypothetical protein [Sulfurimonas sp.]
MTPLNILKIIGIPDDNKAVVIQNDGLFRQFALFFEGNSSFLEDTIIPNTTVTTLHLGGVEQLQNIKLPFKPDIVFNAICDPEIQNRSLALLDDMKFKDILPMLNTTQNIRKTKRDELSQNLPPHKDFIIPKTYRIKPHLKTDIINSAQKYFEGKAFLFRPVSSHGGTDLIRIDDYHLADFDAYSLDEREYFISEFIDFKSSDGLYRKARFFVIDGVAYPRHYLISQEWKINLRHDTIDDNYHNKEEEKFMLSPPKIFDDFCHYLHTYLKLDFFGIDCAILENGKIVLFEANVCMRPFTEASQPYIKSAHIDIQKAFAKLINLKKEGTSK